MNTAANGDPGEQGDANVHATLRFATAVTAVFVLCEALQWAPTFMAPVLTAFLISNLPMRPPLKLCVVLVVTMAAAALFALAISTLLRGIPFVLFGLIALCMCLSFLAMASGRQVLPFMLLLISLATIPVVALIAPAQAGVLPTALIGGIALAMLAICTVYVPWPRVVAPAPAAAPAPTEAPEATATPLAMALLSTAVVLPVMLVYLLFGLADVLPVLIATVLLVVNFDLQRGRVQAMGMILGNFAGGLLGLLLHSVLLTTPNLPFLAILLFLVLLGFGQRIAAGGAASGVAVIACNAMLIILSSAISSETGSLALWLIRLFQFALAGAFAVGMMTLFWHLVIPHRSSPARRPTR